jgi:hypothetical protein
MKTKFKMTKEEMLNFNDDCNNACGQSPGYRNEWAIEDRDICLGNITAKALVKHWKKSRILWRNGFSECLSPDAAYVFEEYEDYRESNEN